MLGPPICAWDALVRPSCTRRRNAHTSRAAGPSAARSADPHLWRHGLDDVRERHIVGQLAADGLVAQLLRERGALLVRELVHGHGQGSSLGLDLRK
jgi:hypothetical protein